MPRLSHTPRVLLETLCPAVCRVETQTQTALQGNSSGLQELFNCTAAYSYADHVTLGCWLEVLDVDEEVTALRTTTVTAVHSACLLMPLPSMPLWHGAQ